MKHIADVNLWGMIDVTNTFLPLIKKSQGRVVNLSSLGGQVYLWMVAHGITYLLMPLRVTWRRIRPPRRTFNVSLVMLLAGFLNTWPMQFHLLLAWSSLPGCHLGRISSLRAYFWLSWASLIISKQKRIRKILISDYLREWFPLHKKKTSKWWKTEDIHHKKNSK